MGRKSQSVILATLALAACHSPGGTSLTIAQANANWADLPLREASPTATTLTLYADGWGLVNQTANLALEKGEQVVSVSPVAGQVEPRGAYLQIPGIVSDRRFRFDLSNRERLLERYHGLTVEIVTATGSIPATLLMTESGAVYKIGDRLVPDPPGRVSLPPLPGLAVEPRLEWIVSLPAPWTGQATASYVVNRLGWENEYTLVTDEAQQRGEWTQWAAISNQSGGSFPDARITLIAGDVRRDDRTFSPINGGARAFRFEAAPAESFASRYLYRLPRPMTLERNSENRVNLAKADGLPLTRSFRIVSSVSLYREVESEIPRKAQLRLTVPNTEAANLGKPLPRGKVTVYTPTPQGEAAVAGEPMIPDTPKGQTLILDLGEAFDVTARRKQTQHEVTNEESRLGYAITLRNQQDQAVTVDLIEQLPGDWSVISHSHPYERLSASELGFRPTIPAGGELTITYSVSVRTEENRPRPTLAPPSR